MPEMYVDHPNTHNVARVQEQDVAPASLADRDDKATLPKIRVKKNGQYLGTLLG